MHRFDKQFSEVGPVTSRPFSWGHPDGVWIIAIFYMLFALAGAIFGFVLIVQDVKSGSFPVLGAANLVLVFAGYVPAVVFLFRRSAKAVVWLTGLFIWIFAAGVMALLGGIPTQGSYFAVVIGVAIAVLSQGYITYYAYSLRKDRLLL